MSSFWLSSKLVLLFIEVLENMVRLDTKFYGSRASFTVITSTAGVSDLILSVNLPLYIYLEASFWAAIDVWVGLLFPPIELFRLEKASLIYFDTFSNKVGLNVFLLFLKGLFYVCPGVGAVILILRPFSWVLGLFLSKILSILVCPKAEWVLKLFRLNKEPFFLVSLLAVFRRLPLY